MRLIDADKLNFEGQRYNQSQMKAILDFVDAQPTAYSVEKVVAELKENSKVYCEEYHQREGSLYIQDVVEIVRNGGMKKT